MHLNDERNSWHGWLAIPETASWNSFNVLPLTSATICLLVADECY